VESDSALWLVRDSVLIAVRKGLAGATRSAKGYEGVLVDENESFLRAS
jgi:hypothetical protein